MPSLNLTRWREECLQLARQVDRPQEFQSSLRAAFASHSHRSLRRGPSLAAQGALPSWNVPAIMVHELEAALAPVFRERQTQSLALADMLWEKGYYEERLLAVFILQAAAEPDQALLRISNWARSQEDPRLMKILAERGMDPLRRRLPDHLEALVAQWIDDGQVSVRRLGWTAIRSWLESDPDRAAEVALRYWPLALRERDHECQLESRQALVAFAQSRPWEAMRLIEDLPAGAVISSQRLLRAALPLLPPQVAEFLRTTLNRHLHRG
ncbi:MAG: DNA alkylation repair protein [Anaerolineales bacterium]|jgi:hypothetical protein